jgi:hypothetical protein
LLAAATLTDSRRLLGAEHPNTLTSGNNLASAYRAAGRLDEAIPLFEQILTDRRRLLGAEHPDTLTSGNGLAHAYIGVVAPQTPALSWPSTTRPISQLPCALLLEPAKRDMRSSSNSLELSGQRGTVGS